MVKKTISGYTVPLRRWEHRLSPVYICLWCCRGGQNDDLLPSTQQVADLAFVFKKGRVDRSMLTTFNLWKGMTFPQAGSLKIINLLGKVGYWIDVEHSTYLQVSMPTSAGGELKQKRANSLCVYVCALCYSI
jgi:hypothetical protein